MTLLETYITKFAKLRSAQGASRWPAVTRHRAPHKPLLLLAVLDQCAEGTITTNLIEASPALGELFTLYWARVMAPDQRGNLALPFFHLRGEGFWHLLPRHGLETHVAATRQIDSLYALRLALLGARLDEDLFALVQQSSAREPLRRTLIESYFVPAAQAALIEQSVTNQDAYQYSETLLRQAGNTQTRERLQEAETYGPLVRDQGFRRAVIGAYDHRCAFCGLRVLTPDGHTAADAAHIVPWSRTHNDRIGNGMALCKLCHWGFDEGLLTASDRLRVQTSSLLTADYNIPGLLPQLHEKPLTLPARRAYWPDESALRVHRTDVFRR